MTANTMQKADITRGAIKRAVQVAFGGLLVTVARSAVRTWLEDRTLQDELPGYHEYAARVRYRLVYRVW